MPDMDIVIRPPRTSDEVDAFFRLGVQIFNPEVPREAGMAEWRDSVLNAPGFHPSQVLGAYRGESLVGGMALVERRVRLGAARLRTSCVDVVMTHPDHRHQGVASALLRYAISRSLAEHQALLILEGIRGFYGRFGFIDVIDVTVHSIRIEDIPAEPAILHTIRPATVADAPGMLAIHQQLYGGYPGSWWRGLDEQEHLIRSRAPNDPVHLAVDAAGAVVGWLMFGWDYRGARAGEATFVDWSAALALLRHHARLVEKLPEPTIELRWPLPPDSLAFYALADHLPLCSRTDVTPDGGWLARPAYLPALLESLLPAWQGRWNQRVPPWTGRLTLEVGDEREGAACTLELGRESLRMVEPDLLSHNGHNTAHFGPKAFTQLVFGYRPVSWLATQPGQSVPPELWPVLEVLFPKMQAWIAGSDSL